MEHSRTLLSLTGADRVTFLTGLTTNGPHANGELAYAALLTPQGKYIADFFLLVRDEDILIDVATPAAAGLVQRLNMYKLRADVKIAEAPLFVTRGTGPAPDGALPDPRHSDLGWRLYGDAPSSETTDWDALRVAQCIPETGIELTPDTFILEAGFERLNGVDFKKGCYVGQEVTARMKHKTELRKGFVTVDVDGDAETGAEITKDGKPVGKLFTRSGDKAIAYLRLDRAEGDLQAGQATVRRAD